MRSSMQGPDECTLPRGISTKNEIVRFFLSEAGAELRGGLPTADGSLGISRHFISMQRRLSSWSFASIKATDYSPDPASVQHIFIINPHQKPSSSIDGADDAADREARKGKVEALGSAILLPKL